MKKIKCKRVDNVILHLCKVQEWTKMIFGDGHKNSDFLESRDGDGQGKHTKEIWE